jgi:hypothetical protein
MKCTKAFTKDLDTKVTKTKLARAGKGIYNRHNGKAYRVIIHYNTYIKIVEENIKILNRYEDGYVVMVKPNQYFNNNGEVQKSFHKSLKLGKNSFLYFESSNDWKKYEKYCKNFKPVYELHTGDGCKEPHDEQWIGEIAKFIPNAQPPQYSLICTSGDDKKRTPEEKEEHKNLQNKYGNKFGKIPKQAGLGNLDIDYASREDLEKICYQLSLMIFKVSGMKEELIKRDQNLTISKINEVEKHVIDFCEKNNLYDIKKLSEIRAINKKGIPLCPLCLEELNAQSFFEKKKQDEGRETTHNTQAQIHLMHIEPLRPMKFNHRVYNLGWGHEFCNKIQGERSIKDTLDDLRRILKKQDSF